MCRPNAVDTVSAAVEDWLQKLGHTTTRSSITISGDDEHEANIRRTQLIIDEASQTKRIIRQAASLSSLAIADGEIYENDHDALYQGLLLQERETFRGQLDKGHIVRLMISPQTQIDRVELGLVDREHVERNVLPRYDQLLQTINDYLENQNLQIVFMLRLPHDNMVIIDNTVTFIGRKRRRQFGFPSTTQIFDPVIIRDETEEFDAIFDDNVGPILGINNVSEELYGSAKLKQVIIENLRTSKDKIENILRFK